MGRTGRKHWFHCFSVSFTGSFNITTRLNGIAETQPSSSKMIRLWIWRLPVEIIEEREQVEAQFAPGLLLAVIEDVGVHHADGVVHDLWPVGRPVKEPEKKKRSRSLARAHTWRNGSCLTRHLLWDRTSTDGRRAAGYLGQVWPTLRHTWTSGRRARGWSTPVPPAETEETQTVGLYVTQLLENTCELHVVL